ncbi:MAG: hypothetical protein M3326_08190, partial [Actinomycetota bacterium]|nr:hypothetical protein [Actinomycetota bacterium]
PTPPSDEERLDQITERVGKARSQAEEAGILVDEDEEEEEPGEEFAESGETEEEDDQTIAPPG